MYLAELEVCSVCLWWVLCQQLPCLRASVTTLIQQRQTGPILPEVSLLFETPLRRVGRDQIITNDQRVENTCSIVEAKCGDLSDRVNRLQVV